MSTLNHLPTAFRAIVKRARYAIPLIVLDDFAALGALKTVVATARGIHVDVLASRLVNE